MERNEGTSALKSDTRYSLADWRSWPEGERWELINGFAFGMSPAPRVRHQRYGFDLGRRLGNFLENKPCQLFMAPLDVFLEEISATVVEPDVLVVCDEAKIGEDGIHGAPDFIAEVLSDSTANKDFGVKKELYERTGVREYWIIQTDTGTVYQYVQDADSLVEGTPVFSPVREHRKGRAVESVIFPGFRWHALES